MIGDYQNQEDGWKFPYFVLFTENETDKGLFINDVIAGGGGGDQPN